MIPVNDIRKGTVIIVNDSLAEVLDFSKVKPGKGGAFVRTKIKFVKTGVIVDKMFRADEKVERAVISSLTVEYIYRLEDMFHFMSFETNEEFTLSAEQLGDKTNFLVENNSVTARIYQGRIIDIEMPSSVVLTVSETEPGLKGDTVSGATKNAVLQTGYSLQVPLFVKINDAIKVDTRNGKYIGRC